MSTGRQLYKALARFRLDGAAALRRRPAIPFPEHPERKWAMPFNRLHPQALEDAANLRRKAQEAAE